MPDFQYTAREATGKQITGVLAAGSRHDALAALSARSLFPLKVDLAAEAVSEQRYAGRRVRPRYMAVFYSQLADLLHSGVPLLRSLDLLYKQSTNTTLKLVIEDVRQQVSEGTPLAEAMRKHPKAFGELAVSMVRAGEEGGFMEDVLKRISAFTEHQQELKSRVLGAMVYPAFLMGIGAIIVSCMLVFFVPKFEPIFERMSQRGQLPWATTTLMGISEAAQNYWIVGVGLVALIVFIGIYWTKTDDGRRQLDTVRLKAPGLGPIVRSLAVARFCRILGTLLRNGVPILQSLRISKDATGNVVLAQAINEATDDISAGKSLAGPLSKSGHFPEEVVEMISVGEEANNLEQVLIDIAENMERRTNRNLDMFVRMLEPVLLTVMAGIILFVVIALLWPILQSSNIL